MRIQIPTINTIADYNGGAPLFPEVWFTLDELQKRGRIQTQTPSFNNGDSLFQDGTSVYEITKESLNDIHQADGIVFENPFVWVADVEIFDILMQDNIPGSQIPTGGVDHFSNINKFTSIGTEIKTVGEWVDSQCEVWKNEVLGKVQIYTSPINARFIEFHLVKAFEKEYTIANHGALTNDTNAMTVSDAEAVRTLDLVNWIKQQPS